MIDSRTKLPENRIHLFDPIGLINETYGPVTRRAIRSYDGFGAGTNGGGGLSFAVEDKVDGDFDGSSSPPLWKSSSPPISPRSVSSPPYQLQPEHNQNCSLTHHSQPMSPNSRTEAIARGRRELMEMIKDVPESYYELTLKDLVEQESSKVDDLRLQETDKVGASEKKFAQEKVMEPPKEKGKENQKKGSKKIGKSESKKKMVRNTSIDNGGFLLKTSVFPIPFRSKKRRSLNPAPSFKVAPKPPPHPPTSKGSMKRTEKDWWGRKSRVSSESESGGLSSSNSDSAGSSVSSSRGSSASSRHIHNNRFLPSCCSFFGNKRIKPKK